MRKDAAQQQAQEKLWSCGSEAMEEQQADHKVEEEATKINEEKGDAKTSFKGKEETVEGEAAKCRQGKHEHQRKLGKEGMETKAERGRLVAGQAQHEKSQAAELQPQEKTGEERREDRREEPPGSDRAVVKTQDVDVSTEGRRPDPISKSSRPGRAEMQGEGREELKRRVRETPDS